MGRKLKEKQFYCVTCRNRVTCHSDNIFLKTYKVKHRTNVQYVPALKCHCPGCGQSLTKFVSLKNERQLSEKYGGVYV